ncbi:MAG: hydroxymethylglutaryl-CoA lyase [Marinilabiliales bacterium]|nr:MAG: hydroxymethylglutaryl-CoA lyase [Marinilabiliales bacterium]
MRKSDVNSLSEKVKKDIQLYSKKRNHLTSTSVPPKSVMITECPRDAMQGIRPFISTEKKARYINALLKVGFDIIDFGSFVSPKAIPQLRDTGEVLKRLEMDETTTKLLAIVGNIRGGNDAASFPEISIMGFPYSVSDTFLQRNLGSSIEKSTNTIKELLTVCEQSRKELQVYISMGFGNPYDEDWNVDMTAKCALDLIDMGVKRIGLSDTIGSSTVTAITELFSFLVPLFPDIEFSFHMHTSVRHWYRKLNAAWESGCRSFDTVINGLGGCPAADEGQLVGNLRTANLLEFLEIKGIQTNIDEAAFLKAVFLALKTFPSASIFKSDEQN